MRKTGILITCPHCNKEFELFSDDGAGDTVICWNYCPYCHKKVDVWIRFKNKSSFDKNIPLGISYEEVKESGKTL